jgi:hypothetical protein
MTNPKTDESRPAAARSKPPAASAAKANEKTTRDAVVTTNPPPLDPNAVLAQLVSLTQSISVLVQQNVEDDDGQTPQPSVEQARVLFAYDFLGVVLGRRAPSLFQLTTVNVERNFGTLTFTNLGIAKVARIRAANNRVKVVQGLQNGVPVTIDQDTDANTKDAIDDNQRIDSIVTFTSLGGAPVAIGPCLGPVGFIDGVD